MKYLLLVLLLIPIKISYGSDINCLKNPIFCQIVKNKKNVNIEYARLLSNIIYKKSKKYNIDAKLFTAMLYQESKYNIKAINSKSVVRYNLNAKKQHLDCLKRNISEQFCKESIKKYKRIKLINDIGIGQINKVTIKNYNFDPIKILNNLDYSIDCAALVLSDITKIWKGKESHYWTRYNASSMNKRLEYKRKVTRFL